MQTTEVQEQPNRIQVVVRVRPVLPHELADDVAVTCSSDARKLQVLLPDRLSGGANVLPGATRSGARSYEFDACLPGSTSQEELYETCGLQELVEAALDGYCVTVFAFGQTGSGKTHSIIGPRLSRGERAGGGGGGGTAAPSANNTGRLGPSLSGADRDRGGADDLLAVPGSAASARSAASAASAAGGAGGGGAGGGGGGAATISGGITVDPEDGILTRCIAAAYRSIEARSATAEFAVTASVVELYNEAVTDLLALDKTKQLQVRKDSRDGFAVTGLTQVSCPTDAAAVRYMVRALQYRHTRGHRLNEYSSRSHCLMTFVFASKEAGPDGQMGAKGGIRRYGKLALVDLAGSERLKETGNTEKGAVRETGSINKSLFTLGQVLAALSARSSGAASTFVPFRDSKLTQLLWDGLRGSGRCLMLACLGPMRSAVEESLNTLHFATIATRIKAEPVVLLDPQDQLVLDLRKTINQLREENRQLAGALQQLSGGADPNAVLAALPETIRAHTGSMPYGSGGAASMGSGTASPTPPDEPGSPLRQQQQQPHHLQPLQPWQQQVLDRTPRQTFESAVLEASTAVGNNGAGGAGGPGNGAGFVSGIPQPPHRQQLSAPATLVQGSASSAPLRASYGSSVGGGGGGGGGSSVAASSSMPQPYPLQAGPPQQLYQQQSPQLPSYLQQQSPPLPPPPYQQQPPANGHPQQYQQYQQYQPYTQQQRGPPPLMDVPNQASPVSSRSRGKPAVGSGGNGRRPSPVQAAYGNGGRKAGGAAKGVSPRDGGGRSKSVGRGRPTYLTEDPGALLFGFSNVLQPPPGSGNSSSMSLPALVPPAARGPSGVAPPPPMLTEFPELAAMEAEFQSMMANGGVPKRAPATSGSGAVGSGAAASASGGSVTAPGGVSGGGAAAATTSGEADDDGPRPDVRALKWAERNSWFGSDYDMTAFAYQVHDRLVDVEHVDPASDLYYMEIERRVAEKFPERWARAMRGQLAGGSGAAAAAAVRRAAPSDNRVRAPGEPPGSSPQPASPSYSAALRVHVKEPLHRSGSSGAGGATNREIAASLAAQAAVARAKQQQLRQQQQQLYQQQPPQLTASYDSGPYEPSYGEQSSNGGASGPATPQYGAVAPTSGSAPETPPLTGVNPFNIGALHSVAPPKAPPPRAAAAPGQGGLVLVPAGAEPLGRGGSTALDALAVDPNAAERIQREYARQRAMVVEELRKAKEDAEAERQRILARIQRAAGGNKWR